MLFGNAPFWKTTATAQARKAQNALEFAHINGRATGRTHADAEEVFGDLGDDPVRQPEYDTLVDTPRLECVSEGLVAHPDYGRWFIVPLALRAGRAIRPAHRLQE